MTVPFEIAFIDHVVLRATDARRLEAFYTDVLGCPVVRRQERTGLTQLRAGNALIDIVPIKSGNGVADKPHEPNMEHFCLRVDPFDPDAIRQHLDRHAITYSDVVDRFGAEGRGPSIYLQDPEGNRVELKGPSTDRK